MTTVERREHCRDVSMRFVEVIDGKPVPVGVRVSFQESDPIEKIIEQTVYAVVRAIGDKYTLTERES